MATFAVDQTLKVTAKSFVLAILVAPGSAFSQDNLAAIAERERQIVATIETEESQNGPYSEALIGPVTNLSLLYEESGDFLLADVTIERVLQLIRANYGLYSLEQAPSIRRLISHEEERGNYETAWDLDQELMRLAARHLGETRTARIIRESGDKRMEILRRYDAGEPAPEIELGCYYNDSREYIESARRGSRPLATSPGRSGSNPCGSGSRGHARRSIVAEAQSLYSAAINIYLRDEAYDSEEFRDLLMDVVHISYSHGTPGYGRRSLRYLIAYEAANSSALLTRMEALVQLADWDLLYSSVLGGKYRDAALAAYREAYDSLNEHGIAQASITEMFSPETPVMLPSFAPSPLVSPASPGSTEYIDVGFVITMEGKAQQIEILERTENATRADRNALVRLLKRSKFRPRVTNDEFADSAPLIARYYLGD